MGKFNGDFIRFNEKLSSNIETKKRENLMESLSLEYIRIQSTRFHQNQSNQHKNQETFVIQWGI